MRRNRRIGQAARRPLFLCGSSCGGTYDRRSGRLVGVRCRQAELPFGQSPGISWSDENFPMQNCGAGTADDVRSGRTLQAAQRQHPEPLSPRCRRAERRRGESSRSGQLRLAQLVHGFFPRRNAQTVHRTIAPSAASPIRATTICCQSISEEAHQMIGHPRQQPGHARIVEYRECGPAPARFGCDGRDGGQTGEIDQQEDEQRQGGCLLYTSDAADD